MASRQAVAIRHEEGVNRIVAAMATLEQVTGVAPVSPEISGPDLGLARADFMVAIGVYLEQIASAIIPPAPKKGKKGE